MTIVIPPFWLGFCTGAVAAVVFLFILAAYYDRRKKRQG